MPERALLKAMLLLTLISGLAMTICSEAEDVFTVTPLRLSHFADLLDDHGRRVVTVSIDDFYYDRAVLKSRSKNGVIDFDSPDTIDTKELSLTLREIFDDDETVVEVPTYDFKTGTRGEPRFIPVDDRDIFIVEGIQVFYPVDGVSKIQKLQMVTQEGSNVCVSAVKGNFDDCQRLVKSMFRNEELRRQVRITSANSINLLRWIPQSFYYFYGYCAWKRMTRRDMPTVVVPSGNYGNLTAGMLARCMGLPLKGFVAASNANDVIPKFLLTEEYRPRASVQTVANAMDVGDPSNFERMMALCSGDVAALKCAVKGFSCSDDEILAAINEIYERYDYLSDPHSAVGYLASKYYAVDGFWLSTAHAAKFSEVTKAATMQDAPIPEGLGSMMQKPRNFTPMEAKDDVLCDYLRKL